MPQEISDSALFPPRRPLLCRGEAGEVKKNVRFTIRSIRSDRVKILKSPKYPLVNSLPYFPHKKNCTISDPIQQEYRLCYSVISV